MRTRIAAAGGLDFGGFTDIVSVLKIATERRRPDAVYLLSDGVATIGELETEKIVGAVVKVALSVKVPVHTIAIGVGQDVAGLLTDEFDLVTKEIRSELRLSLFVLGVLSVLSVAAVLTLSAAAVLGLSRVLEPPLAAAVVGASIAAFAVIFALVARRWRHKMDLVPQQTIQTLKETKAWAKGTQ